MLEQDRIIQVNIENQMQSAYIDYAMSVIVSRALPDVRDGFKPVHRRVLYGMEQLGNVYSSPHKKSVRIVGDVLGKFHPHGDSSVYFAMARMAQDWSLRYPLVDGQGNYGSIDGDSPAAMRYTEARLAKMGEEMMSDIDEDTVDFVPNFDNTLSEPEVLPTRFPNLLVNGASGIAVGMATNMPPHNLKEAIDASIAYLENPDIEISELMHYIKAPDFPTGGTIYGYAGVRDAFETGRGRIIVRSKAEIEASANHEMIVVSEIPYGVIKRELVKSIADLVEEKKIEGIAEIRDLSNRNGVRIEIDIKRDSNAQVILNKLYKLTQLQSSFSVNNIALVNGRPKTLNLKDLLKYFIEHRHEVVIRRTRFRIAKHEARAHILRALITACDHIQEVVNIIRASKNDAEAKENLCNRFDFDDVQAQAIVDMRLGRLTNMNQDKFHKELEELLNTIEYLNSILNDPMVCQGVIRDELLEVKEKFGDERKTDIKFDAEGFSDESFFNDDEMIITLSHLGYIKRTPLSEFRAQSRGGVGAKGSDTRDEDFIEYIYPASNHNTMMFFTQKGRCYWLKVYEIPEGGKNTKGRAIQNLLSIESDDKVNACIKVKKLDDTEFINSHNILFCTKNGIIKKTCLEAYSRPRVNGVNAINILDNDRVVDVCLTDGNSEIILANRNGRAIRFHETKVRPMGRTATGVKGMTLDDENDEIIGMLCMAENTEDSVMVVSEKGYGKRSLLEDYRVTNRGGKGVKTINITDKTGSLVAIKSVNDNNDLMIINKSGITLRMKLVDIRIMGRATQGVRLINLEKRNDEIASVCKVDSVEEIEEIIEENTTPDIDITVDEESNANE